MFGCNIPVLLSNTAVFRNDERYWVKIILRKGSPGFPLVLNERCCWSGGVTLGESYHFLALQVKSYVEHCHVENYYLQYSGLRIEHVVTNIVVRTVNTRLALYLKYIHD